MLSIVETIGLYLPIISVYRFTCESWIKHITSLSLFNGWVSKFSSYLYQKFQFFSVPLHHDYKPINPVPDKDMFFHDMGLRQPTPSWSMAESNRQWHIKRSFWVGGSQDILKAFTYAMLKTHRNLCGWNRQRRCSTLFLCPLTDFCWE